MPAKTTRKCVCGAQEQYPLAVHPGAGKVTVASSSIAQSSNFSILCDVPVPKHTAGVGTDMMQRRVKAGSVRGVVGGVSWLIVWLVMCVCVRAWFSYFKLY